MRVIITGGGTGGHTSAGLAVAAALRARADEVAWIGSRDGVEARRAPEAGIAFHPISVGKLRRYWDWQNVPDLAWRAPAGVVQSLGLLRRLEPDLVFATGGFVALPVALAARAAGVPLVIHEQTSVPGLANRIAGRLARRIATTFPTTAAGFPAARVTLTGNPLRPELCGGSREEACRLFGLDAALPIVYLTGGAQGSHKINRTVGEMLDELLAHAQVIHQSGDNPETGDRAWLAERAQALPGAIRSRYALAPYVGAELRHVYAAADLVIGRSGAGTVNECCHLSRPAIFIPLPGTSGDEQTVTARLVEAAGGAVVLPQASLTGAGLLGAVARLLADRAGLAAMGVQAHTLAVADAAGRIARLIAEVAGPEVVAGTGSARDRGARPAAGRARRSRWPVRRPPEYLPLQVARPKGYFTDRKAHRDTPSPRAGAPAAEMLAAGRSPSPPPRSMPRCGSARREGMPPRLVFGLTAAPPVVLLVPAARKDTVKAVADLAGKTIGIVAPGTPGGLALFSVLAREGLGAHQVTIQSFGERPLVGALESGAIDAAMLQDPWASRLIEEGKVVALADLRTAAGAARWLGGPTVHAAVFVAGDTKLGRVELIPLTRALLRALARLGVATPEELAVVLPPAVVGTPEDFALRLRGARGTYLADGRVSGDAFARSVGLVRARVGHSDESGHAAPARQAPPHGAARRSARPPSLTRGRTCRDARGAAASWTPATRPHW